MLDFRDESIYLSNSGPKYIRLAIEVMFQESNNMVKLVKQMIIELDSQAMKLPEYSTKFKHYYNIINNKREVLKQSLLDHSDGRIPLKYKLKAFDEEELKRGTGITSTPEWMIIQDLHLLTKTTIDNDINIEAFANKYYEAFKAKLNLDEKFLQIREYYIESLKNINSYAIKRLNELEQNSTNE
jgi:hypothetical protein